jgi:putative DNA primase/helicase
MSDGPIFTPANDPELRRLLRQGKEFQRANGAHTAKPLVQLVGGELPRYAIQCEKFLSNEVYQRAGKPVRIGQAAELPEADALSIERDASQAVIIEVGAEYVRRRLTQLVEFQREAKKGWRTVDCPRDLARNIIEYGEWPHFAPLLAIAVAPFVRPDYSICEEHGYDEATGIYYQPIVNFPRVPLQPSRDDAERARQTLLAPFADFPFVDGVAVSAFVSHVLTAVTRAALDVAPVFVYSAPAAGTGKTLLMRMANRIANGCEPAMRPYSDEPDEMRKVLYASLLAGDSTIAFDNLVIGSKVRSPTLCGFVTALRYSDRKLGTSESREIVNRTLVALTGNNITPCGDLARRSITCRLVVEAERTDGREFRIPDLDGYVKAHRAELLVAALTIIRAFIVAGRPTQALPMPSFERWSALARDPLLWLGMEDPCASQHSETDDEIDPLREAFTAIALWLEARKLTQFQAKDIANAIGYDAEPMREAMAAAGCSDAGDAMKVGYWLRHNLDRTAAGLRLVKRGADSRAKTWRLLDVTRKPSNTP